MQMLLVTSAIYWSETTALLINTTGEWYQQYVLENMMLICVFEKQRTVTAALGGLTKAQQKVRERCRFRKVSLLILAHFPQTQQIPQVFTTACDGNYELCCNGTLSPSAKFG